MVKAEAYGLGMETIVDALRHDPEAGEPWGFGVAAVAEGERLRRHGYRGRILVFSPIAGEEYAAAVAADLTLCLSDLSAVERLARAAGSREGVPFHVEVDTGMGRAGFLWSEAESWGAAVVGLVGDRLRWEGTFTHFHSADEAELAATDRQWERFRLALDRLPDITPAPVLHVANSAAIMRRSGYGCDLARPGIFLYGGRAGPEVEPLPVVSLRARIVHVKEVPAGTTVGYGATYSASSAEKWGTLCIGYGDGLPRSLAAGGGHALVRGVRVPIIGRVSMDMTTVDLSGVSDVEVGDVATLIGSDGLEEIPLDEFAGRCGTISYEILTGLRPRLPRIYLGGEHPAALEG
jgi:alanine racemase